MSKYTEDSLRKEEPLPFTRLRPDVYCGSTETSLQLITEIISNSVDEHIIGNCSAITIDINYKNNTVFIQDDGQGIIPNLKKDGDRTVLQLAYEEINFSGKFDKGKADAVYSISSGSFGIGASLTNFLSHWLHVTTRSNGKFESIDFEEGVFAKRMVGNCPRTHHGVTVQFAPSEKFFDNVLPPIEQVRNNCFQIACMCPDLTFTLNGETIHNPDGMNSLINHLTQEEEKIVNNAFVFSKTVNNKTLNFGLTVAEMSSTIVSPFCNYGLIEGGVPVTTVKTVITRTLNKWGQQYKLLKPNETLTGNLLQEGMIIVFNLISPDIRYDGQTKNKVTNNTDSSFVTDVLSEEFEVWLDNNPDTAKTIINRALLSRKAALAAKKAREAVKNGSKKKGKVFKLPTKLTDCWSKNRAECELYVTEGLSAATGLVAGRDAETVAVYGVRGKILNVLKAKPETIMKNQEINNLVLALGLDHSPTTGKCVYDPQKLRYGKIIAAMDADPDGAAIENLLFNVLWHICPELIINGHVYSAVPPLFRVTTKKNEYIYLRDEAALEEFKSNKKRVSMMSNLVRNKGLGEMDSTELSQCLLDKETRRIEQLTVSCEQGTNKLFQDLYGKAVEPRVKFLLEHLEEAEID